MTRAALGPLQITGIATLLAALSARAARPLPPDLIERIDLKLPCEPESPGRARTEIREAARRARVAEEESGTATLLTSELITNAVIHPQQAHDGAIGLRISSYEDRFRVEVTDSGVGFDTSTRGVRRREGGGNGLFLVDRLASRWGTTVEADGQQQRFCVWFEIET